jgi:hypothetical protein
MAICLAALAFDQRIIGEQVVWGLGSADRAQYIARAAFIAMLVFLALRWRKSRQRENDDYSARYRTNPANVARPLPKIWISAAIAIAAAFMIPLFAALSQSEEARLSAYIVLSASIYSALSAQYAWRTAGVLGLWRKVLIRVCAVLGVCLVCANVVLHLPIATGYVPSASNYAVLTSWVYLFVVVTTAATVATRWLFRSKQRH